MGIRLDRMEQAIGEMHQKLFPERYKEDKKTAAEKSVKPTAPTIQDGA